MPLPNTHMFIFRCAVLHNIERILQFKEDEKLLCSEEMKLYPQDLVLDLFRIIFICNQTITECLLFFFLNLEIPKLQTACCPLGMRDIVSHCSWGFQMMSIVTLYSVFSAEPTVAIYLPAISKRVCLCGWFLWNCRKKHWAICFSSNEANKEDGPSFSSTKPLQQKWDVSCTNKHWNEIPAQSTVNVNKSLFFSC